MENVTTLRKQFFGQGDLSTHEQRLNRNRMAKRAYQELKKNIHQAVIDRVELEKLQRLPNEQIQRELAQLVERIVEEDNIPMNEIERRQLVRDVRDEMLGFGPLEPLL